MAALEAALEVLHVFSQTITPGATAEQSSSLGEASIRSSCEWGALQGGRIQMPAI